MTSEAVNETLSQCVEAFTNDFYKIVSKKIPNDNVISSALSAHLALSMITFGAEGSTAEELKKSLYLIGASTITPEEFKKFIEASNDETSEVILRVVNKIYTSLNTALVKSYQDLTKNSFLSECEKVDFTKNAEAADLINNWCSSQTNGRIDKVMQSDDISGDTSMVLLNAVYFKGKWSSRFFRGDTKLRTFHLDKSNTVEVPTMFLKKPYFHKNLEQLNAFYVGLSYKDENFIFLLIVPNEIDGWRFVESSLENTPLNYEELFKAENETRLDLYLPKFKIESTMNLETILKELGISEIFSNRANLKGISNDPNLHIDKAVQKAFIEVNEEGTEAAAVTVAKIKFRCAPRPAPEVYVDRPFIYRIIDRKRNVTLFSGRVMNPIK